MPRRSGPELTLVDGGAPAPAAPEIPEQPTPARPRALRPDWLPADLELPEDIDRALSRRRAPARPAAPLPPAERRTLVVTGRPADAHLAAGRGPRRSRTAARLAGRPDRVAGWAVLLGILLAAMAIATADGGAGAPDAADPPALVR